MTSETLTALGGVVFQKVLLLTTLVFVKGGKLDRMLTVSLSNLIIVAKAPLL